MSTAVVFPQIRGKENTSREQSIILAALNNGSKGRKRTLTLVNGDELDLSSKVPTKPEIVEAMRLRILQLEDELFAQQAPAKRAKTASTAAPVASSSTAAATASSTKAEEKKRKMQLKKIFDRLKKECKAPSMKFQGSAKTIRFEEVLEKPEFDAIFGDKGTLIQPTPNNKPKSAVTIIHYRTALQINDLFGDELKELKGTRWSRGGLPSRGFGGWGSGGFSKSIKQGSVSVGIRSLEVNHSKNNMKCTLKFEVVEEGGGDDDGYDSDDY